MMYGHPPPFYLHPPVLQYPGPPPGLPIPIQHLQHPPFPPQPWSHSPQQHLPPPPQYPQRPPGISVTITQPAIDTNTIKIHDFWRHLIAPLPGNSTPTDLFARSKPVRRGKRGRVRRPRRNVPPSAEHEAKDSLSSPHPSTSNESDKHSFVPGQSEIQQISFQLDKYANVFIPEWLKNIQKQAMTFTPLAPTPIFPSIHFVQQFLPLPFIKDDPSTLLCEAPPDDDDFVCPPLSPDSYHTHFRPLLQDELSTTALVKSEIVLWQTRVFCAESSSYANQHEESTEFALFVPGIRENHPKVDVCDLVHLREIFGQLASGLGFEGRVTRLRKREGIIQFRAPHLDKHIQQRGYKPFGPDRTIPITFNVSFMTTAVSQVAMDSATEILAKELTAPYNAVLEHPNRSIHRSLARRWLFPQVSDLQESANIPSTLDTSQTAFDDINLNEEQKLAAISISHQPSPVPFLVSGPPGTGKTRTIVEAVRQIIRFSPMAHVLLCAPSNAAADTLALRLAASGLKPNRMLRLNERDRTFAEVPDVLWSYCCIEDGMFGVPSFQTLMQYAVVVTSTLDANILVAARCTNRDLGMLQKLSNAIHPMGQQKIDPHWTHLLIDEAAQASEPEVLIPMSVVYLDSSDPVAIQLVLCGDVNQLGPSLSSQVAVSHDLEVSLLERLFERPLYKDHPLSREKHAQGSQLTRDLGKQFVPFANLVKNYRSHPAILMPPSAMFYNDSLQPCAVNGVVRWSGLPRSELPLLFINCDSKEESNDERATWFNEGEITTVVSTIQSLLAEGDKCSPSLQASQIGVMAPWREQVWKLRERLREAGLHAVDVGSVEDYQGRENRITILSCVRSSPRFIDEDMVKGQGLIHERKRMNVAITRAKETLVVVGNGNCLKKDPYWKSFLQFAIRNKVYRGPQLDIEADGSYISRLESDMVRCQAGLGLGTDEEDHAMHLAGGMARELLRDIA